MYCIFCRNACGWQAEAIVLNDIRVSASQSFTCSVMINIITTRLD